jgi:hypothetical protein
VLDLERLQLRAEELPALPEARQLLLRDRDLAFLGDRAASIARARSSWLRA